MYITIFYKTIKELNRQNNCKRNDNKIKCSHIYNMNPKKIRLKIYITCLKIKNLISRKKKIYKLPILNNKLILMINLIPLFTKKTIPIKKKPRKKCVGLEFREEEKGKSNKIYTNQMKMRLISIPKNLKIKNKSI